MIKIKECRIIYKRCRECGELKFYKKIKNRRNSKGQLVVGNICNSCDNKKRKAKLNYTAICEICNKKYKCNKQEHRNTHHFCSEECRQQYKGGNWLTLNCDQCGKEFRRLKYYIDRTKEDKHFCSQECSKQYQKETRGSKETFICENCGKEIIKKSNTYNPKAEHHFCSRECASQYQTKQKSISLTCSNCNTEFTRLKSRFKEAEYYFCCKECRSEYLNTHNKRYCKKCGKELSKYGNNTLCEECKHNEKYIKFNCAYCGKESERLKIHTKGETLFCSRKCMGLYKRIDPTKLADVSKDPKIVDWSKKVISKFNNTCIKCGKHFDKGLNAHHLNSKDWDKDNMYNVDNGVPLCNECHQDYHMLYGYGNNTEEQFLEWYNEYLDED